MTQGRINLPRNRSMKHLRKSFAALVVAFAPAAYASDPIFTGTFDFPTDAPANTADAARFLTQATFGPSPADVTHLRQVGINQWINEQLNIPPTTGFNTVNAWITAKTGKTNFGQTDRINRWLWQAAYAPDQLRQRMAFALSQIFVISDQNSMLGNNDTLPMTSYYDTLAEDAFEKYRLVLDEVTYHPSMGRYLNAWHNVKPKFDDNMVQLTSPDENYAREVMQLFSVGLIELNLDGSPNGNQVPTYDQSTITHTAKVFTGFTYTDAKSAGSFNGGGVNPITASAPMACWGTELFPLSSNNMLHDLTGDDGTLATPKTVLGGATIPSGQTCEADVKKELDTIASHPNVAPFISRLLIQRFVTSNPSADYISRVTNVFNKTGGDLGDTLKAILTDIEARNPPTLAEDPEYGKAREPLLRLTAIWRIFNAVAPTADTYGEVNMNAGYGLLGTFGQSPLESPTVFNFYSPTYQQPPTFTESGKFSPELQIANESSIYLTTNAFFNFTANAYQCNPTPPSPLNRPVLVLNPLMTNAAGCGTTPSVGDATTIVSFLNAYMLFGTMSQNTQDALTGMINFGLHGASPYEVAWSSIYVTMMSPEFAVQR
jgi:uncharacterized protein (DUF1800 family)